MNSRDPAARKSRVMRTAVPLLLVSHILIIGGGLLLIFGARGAPIASKWVGALLLTGGILVEAWVIRWSIGLIRRAAANRRSAGEHESAARTPPDSGPRFCVACGWRGIVGSWSCPRCGRVLAPVLGE